MSSQWSRRAKFGTDREQAACAGASVKSTVDNLDRCAINYLDHSHGDFFTQSRPNADRILNDTSYAEKAAVKLLDYLTRIDDLRGTGRVYIP
jgi:hypothetical protein